MVLKTMTFLTTAQRVNAVVAIINYEFTNIALLLTALEAAGASITQQGNKRLALIGDAALRLVLHEFGFENEYSIGETPLTNIPYLGRYSVSIRISVIRCPV